MPKVKNKYGKKATVALETGIVDYHEIVVAGNLEELKKHLDNGVKGFNR